MKSNEVMHLAGLTHHKLTATATITTNITIKTLQGMLKRKINMHGFNGSGGVDLAHHKGVVILSLTKTPTYGVF